MSTAWKSAVDNYVSRLSPSQKAEFGKSTTLEEFLQTFSEAYQSHLVRKGLYQRVISGKKKYKAAQRIHDAVREALKQLKRFSGVVDVFAQINQGVGGAIWGPLKMVATICWEYDELLEYFERILSTMRANIKRITVYEEIFGQNEMVQEALFTLYNDYIDFCTRVMVFSEKNALKRVLTSFEGDFKQVYEAMKEHEVRLDACVNAAFISRSTKLRCLEADERKNSLRREVLRWTGCSSDPEIHHRRLLTRVLPGTTDYFFSDPEYCSWTYSSRGLLWINGNPGCGKTTLVSTIVEQLRKKYAARENFERVPVLHYYCRGGIETCTSLHILQSLMHQLLQYREDLFEHLAELYEKEATGTIDSFFVLLPIFMRCLANLDRVCLVIDGLDEINETTLGDLVDGIRMWAGGKPKTKMSLLVASRWNAKMNDILLESGKCYFSMRKSYKMQHENSMKSIEEYVNSVVAESKSLQVAKSSGVDVARSVCEAANGNWLYARLLMEDVVRQTTLAKLRSRLLSLPTGLNELYDTILNDSVRFFEDYEDDLQSAKLIYQWVCLARLPRPMSVEEIGILLGIQKDPKAKITRKIDPDYFPLDVEKTIMRLCSPLLEIDNLNRVVCTHFSVKEYFKAAAIDTTSGRPAIIAGFHEGVIRLADVAKTYTLLDEIQQSLTGSTSFRDFVDENPLLRQVLLPLWDWYGCYSLDFGISHNKSQIDLLLFRAEIESLGDFLCSQENLPWIAATLDTYGQHDLSVLFTRIELLSVINAEMSEKFKDSIWSLLFPKGFSAWFDDFVALANVLEWKFDFYKAMFVTMPFQNGGSQKQINPGPYFIAASGMLKRWSFPVYGRVGEYSSEHTNSGYKHLVDKAISDALKKYSEEAKTALFPIMEMEAKKFCLGDKDLRGAITFKYIPPPLVEGYRFNRQQLYHQARKMFYKGEWDSFWLDLKVSRVIKRVNVGLEKGVRVGDVVFH